MMLTKQSRGWHAAEHRTLPAGYVLRFDTYYRQDGMLISDVRVCPHETSTSDAAPVEPRAGCFYQVLARSCPDRRTRTAVRRQHTMAVAVEGQRVFAAACAHHRLHDGDGRAFDVALAALPAGDTVHTLIAGTEGGVLQDRSAVVTGLRAGFAID